MINVTAAVEINRPIDQVFAYVSNVENWPQWEANFKEAHRASGTGNGVGTTYECMMMVPGQKVRATLKITEYEANRKISFEADKPTMAKPKGSATFESTGTGTRITFLPRPEFSGPFKLLEPLFARLIKTQNEANMNRLKSVLESS
jgi:uncharacterized protein YndB with AHSA1/START domain